MALLSRNSPRIEIGARYRSIRRLFGAGETIWSVEHLFTAADGISHVRLVNATNRKDVKTLSASTLLDTNIYRPADLPA